MAAREASNPAATAPLPHFSYSATVLLDGIRAAAAQAVVIGHAIAFLGLWPWLAPPESPYMQNMAVVVFFVLSGLLITHSTRLKLRNAEREYKPSDFFIDRFSRIYTAFVPALVAVALIDLAASAIEPAVVEQYRTASDVTTFVANLLMLQDYPAQGWLASTAGIAPITAFGSARPLWTVAIEWWIYLAFGWILVLRAIREKASATRLLLYAVPLLLLAIVPTRNLIEIPLGGSGRGNGLFLMWLMGASVSYAWPALARSWVPKKAWVALGATLGLGAIATLYTIDADAFQPAFAAVIALGLACGIAGLQPETQGALRPTRRTGRWVEFAAGYSFSLYLLHYSVISVLMAWARPTLLWVLVMVVVCNLVAVLFGCLFERRYPAVRRLLRTALDRRGPVLTQISRASTAAPSVGATRGD